ncbi:hypothetical protein D9M72_493880 [compost metagenome]
MSEPCKQQIGPVFRRTEQWFAGIAERDINQRTAKRARNTLVLTCWRGIGHQKEPPREHSGSGAACQPSPARSEKNARPELPLEACALQCCEVGQEFGHGLLANGIGGKGPLLFLVREPCDFIKRFGRHDLVLEQPEQPGAQRVERLSGQCKFFEFSLCGVVGCLVNDLTGKQLIKKRRGVGEHEDEGSGRWNGAEKSA